MKLTVKIEGEFSWKLKYVEDVKKYFNM